MIIPRPASPKALVADLRAFLADRSRHQIIGAFLAILMPTLIITGFILDGRSLAPGEQLVYVESWSANRTDAEIMADQKRRQKEREAADAERRRQFQKLADMFGVE
jgi:hypothetical protein